jgi:molybdenum cofactor cytidylyltransferase
MAEVQRIAGLLLAAGKSRRFGDEDKLRALLCGKPLFTYAATALADCQLASLYAICESTDSAMAAQLSDQGYHILANPTGSQSASLRIGATAAFADGADTVLVVLADMPLVTVAMLADMISIWQQSDGSKPLAAFDGEHVMPPVIFGRAQHDRLMALPDDAPGKSLLVDALKRPMLKAQLRDVDTQDDLLNIKAI